MSEAEKLDSIEDVLSSIRRLVADGQRTAPEQPQEESPAFLKEVDIIEIKPAETLKPQVEEPVEKIVEESVAEPTAKLPSFVERMNASIAKITQEKQIEAETDTVAEIADAQVADETDTVAETHGTQVVEFSEIKAEETPEVDEPTDIPTKKPERLILQPAMTAKPENTAETAAGKVPDQDDVEVVEADNTVQSDNNETGVQAIPDEDTQEIALPDDIEDGKAMLAHEEDASEQTGTQFIDEEALRQIVSELVRSELQGDLGDRITRNVRKLVRREIHLALANRDVE